MRARLVLLVVGGLAGSALSCSLLQASSGGGPQSTAPAATQQVQPIPNPSPSPTAETMTVYLMGKGEVEIPIPPPDTLDSLLNQQVENGDWEYDQGLVFLLRYVVGELGPDEISGFEAPQEGSPTGIVRQAQDYLNDQDGDPQVRDEIGRLLGILVPSQDDLDRLSRPAEQSWRPGVSQIDFLPQQDVPAECGDIPSRGFSAGLNAGDYCYVYEETTVQGHRMRVYFPKWWMDDPARKSWADAALQALSDSAAVYAQYGTYGDIDAVFSLTQLVGGEDNLAFTSFFPSDQPCPVTILPLVDTESQDYFRQNMAHEAFHCYQDWNFTSQPYNDHRWWMEGSAEYFSNVVYPDVNYELQRTTTYYFRSPKIQWFYLDYNNFLMFQFLANKLGNEGVLILLDKISSAGSISAQADVIKNDGDQEALFNEFVVATMSDGVRDTSGTMIVKTDYPVLRTQDIDKEGDQEFVADAFVAARYAVRYRQERRFLEEPANDGPVLYSMAADELRMDPGAWSALPPEIRSKCQKDQLYALAVTSLKGGIFTPKINKAEQADCDPCLLGTWEIDPESYAAHFLSLSGAGGLDLTVGGHNYVEFKLDGDIATRLVDFQLAFATGGVPGLITTIDAQGSSKYSTNGQTLRLWDAQESTNSIVSTVAGTGIAVNQTPATTSYSLLGTSLELDYGLPPDQSSPQTAVGAYVCSVDSLEITPKDGGSVLLNRVEAVLPTPVPTAGP